MRVLLATFLQKEWIGGVLTYVQNLETALGRDGHDITTVYGTNACNKVSSSRVKTLWEVLAQGKETLIMPIVQSTFETIKDMVSLFDVVHTQDPFLSLLLRAQFPTIPIVQTIHGINYYHFQQAIFFRRGWSAQLKKLSGFDRLMLSRLLDMENRGMLAANELIAVDTNQANLAKAHGVASEKLTVIYNAVDLESLQKQSLVPSLYDGNAPYFLIARRPDPKNGVIFAIRGFLAWVGNRDVNLLIAGCGSEQTQLLKECKDSSGGNKVIFMGVISHEKIIPLMRGAIATLVPSIPIMNVVEATSLAALESLALGTPVIASAIGGLCEIDGGKKVLSLVPPGDVKAISDSLDMAYVKFLSGRVDRSALIEHVRRDFNTTFWSRKIVAVYEQALKH